MKLFYKLFGLTVIIHIIFNSSIFAQTKDFQRLYSQLELNLIEELKISIDLMELDIDNLTESEVEELNYLTGIYYYKTGDYKTAVEYFKKSLKQRYPESNYYLNKCYIYTRHDILELEIKPDIFSLIDLSSFQRDTAAAKLKILPRNYIRVLLTSNEKTKLEVPAGSKIFGTDNNLLGITDESKDFTIKYNSAQKISISKFGKESFIRIEPSSKINVEGKIYEYPVEFIPNEKSKNMLIVLEVPLEEYLKCVIPAEISHLWPIEMLKAQSIAARTYAVYHMLASKVNYYDVKSDQSSQVFGSSTIKKRSTDRAVDETKNIIMTYNNKPIIAYFYADSGGYTEDPGDVWGRTHPYLKAEDDKFAMVTKWKIKVSEKFLRNIVNSCGTGTIKKIEKIYPHKITKSGRWKEIAFDDGNNTVIADGNKIRNALGTLKMQSLLITDVSSENGDFTLQGVGLGHGVGLPQWSGKNMADANFHHTDILKNYYKGVNFAELEF
ncbi:SpoIID/LytB domain-containing protein [Candidatus Dependentiae bacterium]|nr:SpoIID/LytB domain-containing protein [Candidatus Dependentiae bacterium]